jgi:hypothetical protein
MVLFVKRLPAQSDEVKPRPFGLRFWCNKGTRATLAIPELKNYGLASNGVRAMPYAWMVIKSAWR